MPLFPINAEEEEAESGSCMTNLNWLRASSYQALSKDAGPSSTKIEEKNIAKEQPTYRNCQGNNDSPNSKRCQGSGAQLLNVVHRLTESSSSLEDEPVIKKSKREKKTHKHKKSKKKKSKTRCKSPVPRLKPYETKPPDKVFLEEIKDCGYNLTWRKDTHRDRDNFEFESLNKKHIAKYKTRCKVPMGVSRKEAQTWLNKSHIHLDRYYNDDKHSLIYTDGDSSTGAGPPLFYYKNKSFISVPVVEKGPDPVHNKLGIYDKTTELWSQGRAPDLQQTATTENYTLNYMNSSVRQKITQLNSALREDSSCINTWIELINVQDELLNERVNDGRTFYTHNSILEKKISIIERALKENTGCLELQLLRLELLTPQLDESKLSNEWKNLLFTHVNDVKTWRTYIKSITKKFNKFNVTVLEKAYIKCIKSLKQVLSGSLQTHQPNENTEEELLDILLELCSLLHLSHHTEKCIAVLQSLIEYNWYTPVDLDMKQEQTAHEIFTQFYDSGVPLFGEPGAHGWRNYKLSETQTIPAPLKSTTENDAFAEDQLLEKIKSQPRPQIYLQLETLRSQSHWLPWKPSAGETMESCDDPSRIVISDDVIPYLTYFSTRKLRVKLLFKILDLFGVTKHTEDADRFVRRLLPDWSDLLLYGWFISSCIEQMYNLLTESKERTELTQRYIWYKMKQVEIIADKEKQKTETKELRQYVRSILSLQENRNNLPVWMTFIDILYRRGLITEAKKSLNALMKLYTTGAVNTKLKLVWKLIRYELESSHTDVNDIKSAICWYVHPDKSKYCEMVACLKMVYQVEQHYKHLLEFKGQYADFSVEDAEIEMLTTKIGILLLTISLKNQFKLDSLQSAINSWTESYESSEMLKKYQTQLYINISQILQFVMAHIYPGSKSLIRSFLQQSLLRCPYSQTLLNRYVQVEESSHTITRLRQMFTTLFSNMNSVELEQKLQGSSDDGLNFLTSHQSLSITAVEAELRLLKTITEDIQLTDTGISNRIRSICSRDVRNNKTVSSQLYLLYMRHEAIYGKNTEAKSIFYSAIQSYPYDKNLYMEGIKLLPEMMNEILELCEEKEIRLHTMIDELDILLHTENEGDP